MQFSSILTGWRANEKTPTLDAALHRGSQISIDSLVTMYIPRQRLYRMTIDASLFHSLLHGLPSKGEGDDFDADFDSLSPAEQLKLLMERVSDDDGEEGGEDDLDEEDDLDKKADSDEEGFDREHDSNADFDGEEAEEEYSGSESEDALATGEKSASGNKRLRLLHDESDEEEATKIKSSFEKQQEKLQKRIQELEDENLADKPWMLKGEVSAKHRPMNSLLEHDLDFEHATRPVPVTTEEQVDEIETLIRQRIRDQAWDDVERKNLKELQVQQKKPIALDSEKSKVSLAQIYENEANEKKNPSTLNQRVDSETQKAHDEISTLFTKLCRKIDGLSGYKFAPKAYSLAKEEVAVKFRR